MQYNDYHFSIWFQRSLPNAMARWQYLHSGQMLGGIPDITVLGDGGRRLLIDAKRRLVVTPTRPEETYKMLGYLYRAIDTTHLRRPGKRGSSMTPSGVEHEWKAARICRNFMWLLR